MNKFNFSKARMVIYIMIVLALISWPSDIDVQGSSPVDEESAEPYQVKIYLPVLVKLGMENVGLQPYTGPPPENPTWLEYINYLRSVAGLAAVVENPGWSEGDWLHARYMVKNDYIGHSEDSGNFWFTSQGDLAARTSNLLASSSHSATDLAAIAGWFQAPFHGVGILDPQLQQVGFGSFREQDGGYQMGAALDVIRGLDDLPGGIIFPIAWPGNGSSIPLTSFNGEYPNPLSSCPGYSTPAGLPIILQVGAGELSPQVTSHSFRLGNQELSHCVFHESSYSNPDRSAQSLGRAILDSRDAIVLIPEEPLVPGNTYSVSIMVNGDTHQWSFSTTEMNSTNTSRLVDNSAEWEFSSP
jgi:hypothetical protein